MTQRVTEKLNSDLADLGFSIVRGVFDQACIARAIAGCDELERRAQSLAADTFIDGSFFGLHRDVDPFAKEAATAAPIAGMIRRVTYPYRSVEAFDQLRRHGPLLELIQAVLGDDVKQIVNQVNFNPPGRGTGWGWHQDYRFRREGMTGLPTSFLQSLTAIDACTLENGGLRLIPGSHRFGRLTLDVNPEQAREHFSDDQAVTPELAPGDVVFFNGFVVHGSTPNLSNHPRRVFINGYARAADCPDYGQLVVEHGAPCVTPKGVMEYEDQQDRIASAAKY